MMCKPIFKYFFALFKTFGMQKNITILNLYVDVFEQGDT